MLRGISFVLTYWEYGLKIGGTTVTRETKNVQLRIDAELKNEADKLFEQLGTSTNEAVNLFLKTAVQTRSIPFPVSLVISSYKKQRAIQETYDISDDKVQIATYDSVEDLMKDLNS